MVMVIEVTAPRFYPLTSTLVIGQLADAGEMLTVVEDCPAGITTDPIPPLARQESDNYVMTRFDVQVQKASTTALPVTVNIRALPTKVA